MGSVCSLVQRCSDLRIDYAGCFMNNADLPAMPTHDVFDDCGIDGNSGPHLTQTTNYGLTKREHFAGLAMQGLLASLTADDNISSTELARCSALNADALLAELERTK